MRIRKAIITNICIWLMSLVVRVMRVAVPSDSNSVRERAVALRKTIPRRSRPNPMDTWAPRMPLPTAQSTPSRAQNSISPPVKRIREKSWAAMPWLMMRAISEGRARSV